MKRESFECDSCGAQKKEANHWFRVTVQTDGVLVTRWENAPDAADTRHICGMECLAKTVSAHFSGARP